jgi:precorrin-2 dehydrogenase/sirohydrochlorin ferrochelatase
MSLYPLNLKLEGQLCVVVGGGAVGRRKIEGLLAAGARVRLIDPQPQNIPVGVEICWRPYRNGDLVGALLAIAASDDQNVNAAVATDARSAGILVNVVDDPSMGNVTLPAVLRRGELCVAVASDGGSPALSALVRDRLAEILGPEWETVLEIAAALRQKRLTVSQHPDYNREVLRRLIATGLVERLAVGDFAAVDALLVEVCGAETNLATLGVRMPKGMP